jgi:hypothetical protein
MIVVYGVFQGATLPGVHKPLSAESVVIAVAIVLLVIVLVMRILQGRNLKKRKLVSSSYFDDDVAHYGTGPAGFSGAAAARLAGPTPLAPSFDTTRPIGAGTGDWDWSGAASPSGFDASSPLPFTPGAGVAHLPPLVGSGAPKPSVEPTPTVAAAPAAPGAGWLPDPSGDPDVVRYWDGTAWTDHVAHRSR